jgi:hypothetical protein
MLFLIAIAFLVLLALLRRWSPARYVVHCSRARPLERGLKASDKWVMAGLLYDTGEPAMDISNKFVGLASGDSMSAYGIPNGSTFVADYLSNPQRLSLKAGDIVVVDGPSAYSSVDFRLRRVEIVDADGVAKFSDDRRGKSHASRPIGQIVAQVTHVIPKNSATFR